MALPPSEQVDHQIDVVTKFVRTHLLWILGLLPVVVASLRLLVVTQGDRQVLSELVQGLDIPGLVISSVLPAASSMLFFVMFAWQLNASNRRGKATKAAKADGTPVLRDGNGFWRLTGWILTAALLLTATPLWLVVLDLSVLGLLVCGSALVYICRRLEGRRQVPKAIGAVTGLLMVLVALAGSLWALLLFPTVFSSSVWLPQETIVIRNATGVDVVNGFVLSADINWTRLMTEEKSVVVIRTESVVQRVPLKPNDSMWHRPIASQ